MMISPFIILLALCEGGLQASPASNKLASPARNSVELACGTSFSSGDHEQTEEVKKPPSEVVGGQNANPGEFPWLVKLHQEASSTPSCGGSILDAYHILTAAHCLHECTTMVTIDASNITVKVGAHERFHKDEDGQMHEVEQVIVNEQYCSKEHKLSNNDIGILKLAKPVSLGLLEGGSNSVNTICLPQATASYTDGEPMVLAGFGRTKYEPATYESVLQKVQLPYVDGPRCQLLNSGSQNNFDIQLELCAGGKENEGTCVGDSGGPLVRDLGGGAMELVGVVSRGAPCAMKDKPAIFTRVDAYLEWIAEKTSDSN